MIMFKIKMWCKFLAYRVQRTMCGHSWTTDDHVDQQQAWHDKIQLGSFPEKFIRARKTKTSMDLTTPTAITTITNTIKHFKHLTALCTKTSCVWLSSCANVCVCGSMLNGIIILCVIMCVLVIMSKCVCVCVGVYWYYFYHFYHHYYSNQAFISEDTKTYIRRS
jgi:hypothetical protein